MKAVGNGKRNGTGSWATEEDNVNFKWEIRGEEVLFHTKSGGVIVGEIGREAIGFICPAWGFILSRRPGDDL